MTEANPAPHPAPSWLAIAGPTASGKTALALTVAEHLAPTQPVEIISVDSALVYRGMDIGTAKPTPQERAAVPHHLIDLRDPSQAYSAAEFVRDATALVRAIHGRGALPLLVGGTMLYFKALFEGLDDMPPAQPALRAAIEAQARASGWPALHHQLSLVDPATAARLAPNDAQRIGRALEVYRATGLPLSHFHRRQNATEGGDATPPVRIDGLTGWFISLEPRDRSWLHERIAQRFDAMLQHGFLDEVQALRARGDLTADLPAMRCVGYRQAWVALDAAAGRPLDASGLLEFRDRGIFATRQLAKRQLTWLRSMAVQRRFICDDLHMVEQLLHALPRFCIPAPDAP